LDQRRSVHVKKKKKERYIPTLYVNQCRGIKYQTQIKNTDVFNIKRYDYIKTQAASIIQ